VWGTVLHLFNVHGTMPTFSGMHNTASFDMFVPQQATLLFIHQVSALVCVERLGALRVKLATVGQKAHDKGSLK
jgi:hypothetical protein